MATNFVDKTCRICGIADQNNVDIFENRYKNLQLKITTVFHIIVYKSDPLPKNICHKCITNVSLLYDEHQRVVKVQKKWIDNVRSNQPCHRYIQVLNALEKNYDDFQEELKTIVPDLILYEPRFIRTIKSENDVRGNTFSKTPLLPLTIPAEEKLSNCEILPMQLLNSNEISIERKIIKKECIKPTSISNPNTSTINDQINEIKNKLESHGCTLTTLTSSSKKTQRQNSIETSPVIKDCKYCNLKFADIKLLAKHQLCHLVLSSWKLYETKYLNKTSRRGRIIFVDKKKCVRCLNCWKIFPDHKSTINHWSNGGCDFYCQICGEDFADNPKMLREHVPSVHRISYKSSKRPHKITNSPKLVVRDLFNKTTKPFNLQSSECSLITKIKTEPNDEHTSIKSQNDNKLNNTSLKVQCEICWEVFSNFRSKNSHMRKHKKRPEIDKIISEKNFTIMTNFMNNINQSSINYEISMAAPTSSQLLNEIKVEIKEEPQDNSYEIQNQIEEPKIQVRKLCDLQEPNLNSVEIDKTKSLRTYSKQHCEKRKSDYMDYDKIYKCHPCGVIFIQKSELFKHKKNCEANNIFSCEICLRSFVSTSDLQMHIMMSHKRDS